jgi:hypothetical protein
LVSDPLCLSFYSSTALHFFLFFFSCPHPVNRDDWHLLAHAMASDFIVAWQFSQKKNWFFITDDALLWLGFSPPSCILNFHTTGFTR